MRGRSVCSSTASPGAWAETLATKADLEKTEASQRGEMRELEQRMTIRLGAMMVGVAALVAALVKLV